MLPGMDINDNRPGRTENGGVRFRRLIQVLAEQAAGELLRQGPVKERKKIHRSRNRSKANR
jgi:hypothetical protein